MNALVLYYSLTGNTKTLADGIAEASGGEKIELKEIRKRSVAGAYVFGAFSAIIGRCSRLKPVDFNFQDKELIFIGTPVWASNPTPAINTLLRSADFSDKKIVLFVTAASGNTERAVNKITKAIENKGGKVIGHYDIKTSGVDPIALFAHGEKIGKAYK